MLALMRAMLHRLLAALACSVDVRATASGLDAQPLDPASASDSCSDLLADERRQRVAILVRHDKAISELLAQLDAQTGELERLRRTCLCRPTTPESGQTAPVREPPSRHSEGGGRGDDERSLPPEPLPFTEETEEPAGQKPASSRPVHPRRSSFERETLILPSASQLLCTNKNVTGLWSSNGGNSAALVVHRDARYDVSAVCFVDGRLIAAAWCRPESQHLTWIPDTFDLHTWADGLTELPYVSHGELFSLALKTLSLRRWMKVAKASNVLWLNFDSCAEDDVEEHVRGLLGHRVTGVHISPFDRSHLLRDGDMQRMRSVRAFPCSRTPCFIFPEGPRHVTLVHQEQTLHCVSDRPLLIGSTRGTQVAALALPAEMQLIGSDDLLIIRLAVDRQNQLAPLLQSKLPVRVIVLVPKYRANFLFLSVVLNSLMNFAVHELMFPGESLCWR